MVQICLDFVPGLPWWVLGQFHIHSPAPSNHDYQFSVRAGDLNRGGLLDAWDRYGYGDGDWRCKNLELESM